VLDLTPSHRIQIRTPQPKEKEMKKTIKFPQAIAG